MPKFLEVIIFIVLVGLTLTFIPQSPHPGLSGIAAAFFLGMIAHLAWGSKR
jgi:hypothetical protein